jgi:hypothetical protein
MTRRHRSAAQIGLLACLAVVTAADRLPAQKRAIDRPEFGQYLTSSGMLCGLAW